MRRKRKVWYSVRADFDAEHSWWQKGKWISWGERDPRYGCSTHAHAKTKRRAIQIVSQAGVSAVIEQWFYRKGRRYVREWTWRGTN